ncbi:MAG: hypothetical protein R3279_06765 [Putridiphycobacter sp.]|nr:hypothetical protein [Putridiphycobacter sp.]
MKYFTIIIGCMLLSACCNKKALAPTVTIVYPVSAKEALIVVDAYNSEHILEFSESQNVIVQSKPFIHRLVVNERYSKYIIQYFELAENTGFVDTTLKFADTITNVTYEIKGRCNDKLENFSFYHNGILIMNKTINK